MGDSWPITLLLVSLYAAELAAVLLAVARKRDAASAMAWALAIVLLPGLGLLLFLLIGLDRYPRRLKRKVAHDRSAPVVPPDEGATESPAHPVRILAESLGGSRCRRGNRVDLLESGEKAFQAILAAIDAAVHHIHVEEYIFRDDRLGRRLLERLVERAREGIEVRVLVDAVGTSSTSRMKRELQRAGGRFDVFMPLLPFWKLLTANLRNHRKIIVCDGRVGFLGGMNVGDEYFTSRWRNRYWCDSHLCVEGPAVHDLQATFAEDWRFTSGEALRGESYFPRGGAAGESAVQIVASGPDEAANSMHQVFFTAINEARRRVRIASPYLVPDAAMRAALKSAALRGIEVELLTQGAPPEIWTTWFCSRFYWEELLSCGVRIYEFEKGILHAKLLVADDSLAVVGSANLDNRSLALNFEVSGLLFSPTDIAQANERFDAELAGSREVALDEFRRRPAWHRWTESLSRLLAPLL